MVYLLTYENDFPKLLCYCITGRITSYLPSGGPFVRMDSHVYPDYVVPPSYDSLLGKVCLTKAFVLLASGSAVS